MNIQVIGFDLDNTLYPVTKENKKRARLQIYKEIHSWLNISLEEAKILFEDFYSKYGSGSKSIELIAEKYSRKMDGKEFIDSCLNKVDILEFIYRDPKINELLKYVKSRFEYLDLITSRELSYAFKIMDKLGVDQKLFNKILFTDNIFKKTDGSIYKKWLSLRSIPSNLHLYIGDNHIVDINVPNTLGIKTCHIGNYEKADFTIPNILYLYSIIDT